MIRIYDKLPHNHFHIPNAMAIKFYEDNLSSGESLAWLLGHIDDEGSSCLTIYIYIERVLI